jgi:hypothetical protein
MAPASFAAKKRPTVPTIGGPCNRATRREGRSLRMTNRARSLPWTFANSTVSQGRDNIVPGHALVTSDGTEDRVERADSKGLVVRDCDSLVTGFVCLQNPVAANLVYLVVTPVSAQCSDEGISAQISRELHPSAINSSRTR